MPMRPPKHDPIRGLKRRGRPKRRYAPKAHDPFLNSVRWRKFRRMVLARGPLCADPFGHHAEDGVEVPAQDVHHKIPRSVAPELALVEENCVPLCRSCHGRITRQEANA